MNFICVDTNVLRIESASIVISGTAEKILRIERGELLLTQRRDQ